MNYKIRFIHKIAPRPNEYHDRSVDIPIGATQKEICAALRACGAMNSGQRAREWRREADGRIVVFPCAWRGITTVWHSIILEPQG
jgi:hypothetical protein